jgi:hypothetical protein
LEKENEIVEVDYCEDHAEEGPPPCSIIVDDDPSFSHHLKIRNPSPELTGMSDPFEDDVGPKIAWVLGKWGDY